MGEYTVQASVVVRLAAPDVMRWLTAPDLLTQWMLGADTIRPLDDLGITVGAMTEAVIRAYRSHTLYTGQIAELGPNRLVRRYRMNSRRFGVVPVGVDQAEYERFVAFDLTPLPEGTGVTCTARTVIPGLHRSIKNGHRSSTVALQRSLDRLAACAEGRGISALSKFNDPSKSTGEPL